MNYPFHRFGLFFVLLLIAPVPVQADDGAPWGTLDDPGHFALLRHALAPGTGDPPDFEIDNCATQRNLSEVGREQARTIGDRFRDNGIPAARMYTSQWCRCRDTAILLGLGEVEDLKALNSFFQDFQYRESRTAELLEWLRNDIQPGPVVLVTHQVNITALTGVYPASGELIFVRVDEAGVEVLGRVATE